MDTIPDQRKVDVLRQMSIASRGTKRAVMAVDTFIEHKALAHTGSTALQKRASFMSGHGELPGIPAAANF